ncbi:MAG TPA: hypothetical protein VEO54_05370 [Thermoanaerobaculia bacterium]|nr:hypothetical protein [Thermoanaerobaculia bacterium]
MLAFAFWLLGRLMAESAPPPPKTPVDFARDVRPILERRCQPCHFQGGKMHGQLPFDRPETITKLGDRLFTRIKAKDEQAVIREYLSR